VDALHQSAQTDLDVPMRAHERGVVPSPENPRQSDSYDDAIPTKRRPISDCVLPGQSDFETTPPRTHATVAQHVHGKSLRTKGFKRSRCLCGRAYVPKIRRTVAWKPFHSKGFVTRRRLR